MGPSFGRKSKKNDKNKVQQLINRQVQAITGMYHSTLIQALISEVGLVSAWILPDHSQRM